MYPIGPVGKVVRWMAENGAEEWQRETLDACGWLRRNHEGRQFSIRRNDRGRIVLRTPAGRDIVVLLVERATPQWYALDRHCYHVGYPLDGGDIEDIAVRIGSAEPLHLACINCPLHNRIFDLRNGDLLSISLPSTPTGVDPPAVVIGGRRDGGLPSTNGCHQRVHKISLRCIDTEEPHVVVEDSFESGGARVPSDAYNGTGSGVSFKEFADQ
jgi:nitrite reductase/ring-hydroxylating ferredoxin subunit